jgi:hypothetical protein
LMKACSANLLTSWASKSGHDGLIAPRNIKRDDNTRSTER